MARTPHHPNAPHSPEVVIIQSDEEMAAVLLHETRLDVALDLFAYSKQPTPEEPPLTEGELGAMIRDYTDRLTNLSISGSRLRSDQIKAGFDIVAQEMNRIANEKLNQTPERSRLIKALLRSIGDIPPERRAVTGFTDEEWDRQFREPLEALSTSPRDRQQTNDAVYEIFHGFALAPFSHLPQAYRWA